MAEEIRLRDESNDNENRNDFSEHSGCQLCLKKPSKYTCPRCNVKYCSVECYRGRKHVQCSEVFYKNCVMENLQNETIDSGEKRKMMDILKRFEEGEQEQEHSCNEDLYEFGGENLEERLHGLDLDRDSGKIWEKLTTEERREFEQAVNDGYIGTLVDTWIPWWTSGEKSCDNSVNSRSQPGTKLPKLLKNIPELSSLTNSKPVNDQIKYNILNVLYAYVYICRYYNGSHCEFPLEAVENLWKLSFVLCHALHFDSLDSALKSAVTASHQYKELYNSAEFSIVLIDDVSLLLRGNEETNGDEFVSLALSDIYRLLARALKMKKKDDIKNDLNKIKLFDFKSLWLAKKKIIFMLSWVQENMERLSSLLPFFNVVKEAIAFNQKKNQQEKEQMERCRLEKSRKKLIEEIY